MATAKDIRAARAERGETQETFAGHFGVNQSTIYRWEHRGPPKSGLVAKAVNDQLAELRTNGRK